MTFITKYIYSISLLLLLNVIISISSYFFFNYYSYDGSKRVFKNFYEVEAERNFEFADLDILTSSACFSYCEFFQKNIEKMYFKILSKESKDSKEFQYNIKKDEDLKNIINNKIVIEQKICISEEECAEEVQRMFKNSITSLKIYLTNHIDELIFITNNLKNNSIYNLMPDIIKTSSKEASNQKRVEDIATKLIIESKVPISEEEAVKKAKNIVFNITNDASDPGNQDEPPGDYLQNLIQELESFKNNRLGKIPSFYKIKFIKSSDWELGLKESPFRKIYYNIPSFIKSIFIFIILSIFILILIRIIDRFKSN